MENLFCFGQFLIILNLPNKPSSLFVTNKDLLYKIPYKISAKVRIFIRDWIVTRVGPEISTPKF